MKNFAPQAINLLLKSETTCGLPATGLRRTLDLQKERVIAAQVFAVLKAHAEDARAETIARLPLPGEPSCD